MTWGFPRAADQATFSDWMRSSIEMAVLVGRLSSLNSWRQRAKSDKWLKAEIFILVLQVFISECFYII